MREDVRSIIKSLCAYKNVEIVEGAVCSDHVHLCVCIPPKMSVSSFMGYLKGKSALMIYDKHPELQSKWSKAFWARGYYVAKKLFTVKGEGEYAQSLMTGIKDGEITVSTTQNKKFVSYTYNIKTKKKSKKVY